MMNPARARILARFLFAAAALAAAAAPGRADSIVLKSGLTYEPATILTVADGVIAFRLGGAAPIRKSLLDVAAVKLDGETDFNRAENLFQAGKFAQALAAYDRAEKQTAVDWKKRLLRYRLLRAAEEARDVETAVGRWLQLADATNASKGALAARPRKFAAPRSPANDRAINLLKAKAGTVRAERYRRAILEVLVALYAQQERLDEAGAVEAELAGKTRTRPVTAPAAPTGSNEASLKLARLSLRSGRHREVLQRLEPLLKRFSAGELPSALYLMGTAQLELSGKESDDKKARELLLAGGLNLMRVVALFPDSREVAAALLLAGRVNERLNNPEAARAAYSELVSRHGRSREAGEARQALERLRSGQQQRIVTQGIGMPAN